MPIFRRKGEAMSIKLALILGVTALIISLILRIIKRLIKKYHWGKKLWVISNVLSYTSLIIGTLYTGIAGVGAII